MDLQTEPFWKNSLTPKTITQIGGQNIEPLYLSFKLYTKRSPDEGHRSEVKTLINKYGKTLLVVLY